MPDLIAAAIGIAGTIFATWVGYLVGHMHDAAWERSKGIGRNGE